MSVSLWERAKSAVLHMWERCEAEGTEDEIDDEMLVAADALEEAGLHADAGWLRWSYSDRERKPEPEGNFQFIGFTQSEVRKMSAPPTSGTAQGEK